MAIIERVDFPDDLKKLRLTELNQLAQEIRDLIINTTAQTGGHLAPNLGVVELTIALHYVFHTPEDRIVWDVGHQCYTHKILTGRKERFHTLRQHRGIAGFPKRSESIYDVFDTGHSGNSISLALGSATGDRLLEKRPRYNIAVIGDGSIGSGMALEALNHAGALKQDIIVVLNDNEMSIARSTGAIAAYLNRMITGRVYNRLRDDVWLLLGHLPRNIGEHARVAARKIEEGLKNLITPGVLFEEFGFRYLGPVDGHDIKGLIEIFRRIKQLKGPILVHVVTKKGKGYAPALKEPEYFHGVGPFDVVTGRIKEKVQCTFTGTFGKKLVELAEKDKRIVAVTAGMCLGTGLAQFREKFPERFFDVGICEQHAVSFAAGLAQSGLRPVVAIYSTFLMRAIDQILQDVCLQKLPVVFAVDRAGVVGEDGPTHHGNYDLSYLTMLPGITVLAPRDEVDLELMLEFALTRHSAPIALRYPRGGSNFCWQRDRRVPIELGRGEILCEGKNGAVLAIGSMVNYALKTAEFLREKGVCITVADAKFAKPVDEDLIARLASINGRLITMEENTLLGGFGNAVSLVLERKNLFCKLRRLGLDDVFIPHGPRVKLLEEQGFEIARLEQIFLDFFSDAG